MHPGPHRIGWRGAKGETARGGGTDRGAHAEPESSARPTAHLQRATRAFAASGNDTGRSVVGFGKTLETAARPANDALAASGADRWPQFFAGAKRAAANFPAALCKSRSCGGGQRRVAANSASLGETFDAGEGTARSRAAGFDLSGVSRAGRR